MAELKDQTEEPEIPGFKTPLDHPSEPQFPHQDSGQKRALLVGLLGGGWSGPLRNRHQEKMSCAKEALGVREAGRATRSPRSFPCRRKKEGRRKRRKGRERRKEGRQVGRESLSLAVLP